MFTFYTYQVEKHILHGYLYYYSKHGSFGQSLQLHPLPCKFIPLVIDGRWQPSSWMHSFPSISLNLVFFCCFVEAPKLVKRKCFIQSQSCSFVRNLESNLERSIATPYWQHGCGWTLTLLIYCLPPTLSSLRFLVFKCCINIRMLH